MFLFESRLGQVVLNNSAGAILLTAGAFVVPAIASASSEIIISQVQDSPEVIYPEIPCNGGIRYERPEYDPSFSYQDHLRKADSHRNTAQRLQNSVRNCQVPYNPLPYILNDTGDKAYELFRARVIESIDSRLPLITSGHIYSNARKLDTAVSLYDEEARERYIAALVEAGLSDELASGNSTDVRILALVGYTNLIDRMKEVRSDISHNQYLLMVNEEEIIKMEQGGNINSDEFKRLVKQREEMRLKNLAMQIDMLEYQRQVRRFDFYSV